MLPPNAPPTPPPVPGPVPPPLTRPAPAGIRPLIGLLLVLPAAVALLIGYVWPTLRTAWMSVHAVPPLPRQDPTESERTDPLAGPTFVGLDNYQHVADWYDRPFASLAFLLSPAVPLLLLLLVAAPLLAWAGHRAGRAARWTVRLALSAPMVCFVPAGLAVGWWLGPFRDDGSPGGLRTAIWLSMVGLVVGIGVTCYLAAFRAGRVVAPGPRWAAAGTLAGLAALTVAAVVVQVFTFPAMLQETGTIHTRPPLLQMYYSLQRYEFGLAAAQAVWVLLPVVLLGLAAGLMIVLTGLRIEVDAPERPAGGWSGGRVAALVGAVVGLAALLAATAYGLWPWLSRPGFELKSELLRPLFPASMTSLLANTWLPPLISTMVGVGLAAVAAFGIGALRPLGRWSELLLLPFAPWLFVGVGPLAVAKSHSAVFGWFERSDTFLGKIPPIWLVVPALFILTLLFRGLAPQPPGSAAPAYGRMVLRALPMVGLLAGATWLVQAQSPLWSLLLRWSPRDTTAPAQVMRFPENFLRDESLGMGWLLPLPLVLVLAVTLGVLQLLYLDRLAIRVGRPT